jgi:hypothetical protein
MLDYGTVTVNVLVAAAESAKVITAVPAITPVTVKVPSLATVETVATPVLLLLA